MIDQLPDHFTIFCLIDAISFYETEESKIQTQPYLLMRTLARAVGESSCTFKLLLTSPQDTKFFLHMDNPEADVLRMSDEVERQDRFTEGEWKNAVDSMLAR